MSLPSFTLYYLWVPPCLTFHDFYALYWILIFLLFCSPIVSFELNKRCASFSWTQHEFNLLGFVVVWCFRLYCSQKDQTKTRYLMSSFLGQPGFILDQLCHTHRRLFFYQGQTYVWVINLRSENIIERGSQIWSK